MTKYGRKSRRKSRDLPTVPMVDPLLWRVEGLLQRGDPVYESGESGMRGAKGTIVPAENGDRRVWWATVVPTMVTSITGGTALDWDHPAAVGVALRWLQGRGWDTVWRVPGQPPVPAWDCYWMAPHGHGGRVWHATLEPIDISRVLLTRSIELVQANFPPIRAVYGEWFSSEGGIRRQRLYGDDSCYQGSPLRGVQPAWEDFDGEVEFPDPPIAYWRRGKLVLPEVPVDLARVPHAG